MIFKDTKEAHIVNIFTFFNTVHGEERLCSYSSCRLLSPWHNKSYCKREKKSLLFGENLLYKPLISFKSFKVMELVVKENFILEERRISLSEFHTADEVLSAYK